MLLSLRGIFEIFAVESGFKNGIGFLWQKNMREHEFSVFDIEILARCAWIYNLNFPGCNVIALNFPDFDVIAFGIALVISWHY